MTSPARVSARSGPESERVPRRGPKLAFRRGCKDGVQAAVGDADPALRVVGSPTTPVPSAPPAKEKEEGTTGKDRRRQAKPGRRLSEGPYKHLALGARLLAERG